MAKGPSYIHINSRALKLNIYVLLRPESSTLYLPILNWQTYSTASLTSWSWFSSLPCYNPHQAPLPPPWFRAVTAISPHTSWLLHSALSICIWFPHPPHAACTLSLDLSLIQVHHVLNPVCHHFWFLYISRRPISIPFLSLFPVFCVSPASFSLLCLSLVFLKPVKEILHWFYSHVYSHTIGWDTASNLPQVLRIS